MFNSLLCNKINSHCTLQLGYCKISPKVIVAIFATRCYASVALAVMWCGVCVCVYVCVSVTFVDHVKMNKHLPNFFYLRVANPF